MTREFWVSESYCRRVRLSPWPWVILPISQLLFGRHPLAALPVFLLVGAGVLWRYRAARRLERHPLHIITDDGATIHDPFRGTRHLHWKEIKRVHHRKKWVRLIGWRWGEKTDIDLRSVRPEEQEVFLELIQTRVEEADT